MRIIKNALIEAANIVPSKSLSAKDITFIIDGIIEVTEKEQK
jgi:hypothetical protein